MCRMFVMWMARVFFVKTVHLITFVRAAWQSPREMPGLATEAAQLCGEEEGEVHLAASP